jgi:hypothetical protein
MNENVFNLLLIFFGFLLARLYRDYLIRNSYREYGKGFIPSFRFAYAEPPKKPLYRRENGNLIRIFPSGGGVVFLIFILLGITGCSTTPLAPRRVFVETKTSCFSPTIGFDEIYGDYGDVSDVKLILDAPPLKIPLRNIANRTWQTQLDSGQIQLLVKNIQAKYRGHLKIMSRSGKGNSNQRQQEVEIVISPRDVSTCS